jgi:hypothetical protein
MAIGSIFKKTRKLKKPGSSIVNTTDALRSRLSTKPLPEGQVATAVEAKANKAVRALDVSDAKRRGFTSTSRLQGASRPAKVSATVPNFVRPDKGPENLVKLTASARIARAQGGNSLTRSRSRSVGTVSNSDQRKKGIQNLGTLNADATIARARGGNSLTRLASRSVTNVAPKPVASVAPKVTTNVAPKPVAKVKPRVKLKPAIPTLTNVAPRIPPKQVIDVIVRNRAKKGKR